MNRPLYCLLLSFSVTAVSTCIDDKGEQNLPPVPDFNRVTLKENLHSDGGDVYRTDTYVFNNNKLMAHTTVQESYGRSLAHEVTLSYSGNEVTLIDENGNTSTCILGDAGCATECAYRLSSQIRKYEFTYSGEYLTRVGGEVDSMPYSSMELVYDNGNSSRVIANDRRTSYQVGDTKNLCRLPCLQICGIYPLSLHTGAIYTRLLNAQSKYLIIGNTPEGSEKEYTKYTYELDRDGKPTGIIAETTSTDAVIDIDGNACNETRTDTRTINISIEQGERFCLYPHEIVE